MSNSVILIGMPGAGKSTLGILLAKELGLDFIDTDVAIQVKEGKSLQEIIDATDYLHLREVEEAVLLETEIDGKVVATGGSVVYSEPGMARLKKAGTVIYLDVPLEELIHRIHNYETRGITRHPDQSFEALFAERTALYNRYADIRIDCDGLFPREILQILLARLKAA